MKYIKVTSRHIINWIVQVRKKITISQQVPRTADIKYNKFSYIPKFPAKFSDSFYSFVSIPIEQRWTLSLLWYWPNSFKSFSMKLGSTNFFRIANLPNIMAPNWRILTLLELYANSKVIPSHGSFTRQCPVSIRIELI